MWIVGVDCIVDILNATAPSVNVLVEEFDAAGGQRIFVQTLIGEGKNI